ncbi:hypothetical protein sos41_13930 [Alphaproteobacteria bacterium SO-S41]|nr:hypothetical protein sos41_13930 [Alphaproteobacteria bacterium SO-S41]
MTDDIQELRLVGWYGDYDEGFAIPLFGQFEGANTLYCAVSAISADARSVISRFEAVDVTDGRRLLTGESIPLKIGDPWHDVFIWDDTAYISASDTLWDAVADVRADLKLRAPISMLEMAISADHPDVVECAKNGIEFVANRFGQAQAAKWRRQTVRLYLETHIRQALANSKITARALRSVSIVEETDGVLTPIVEPEVLAELLASDELGRVLSKLFTFAAAMRCSVKALSSRPSENPAPPPENERVPAADAPDTHRGSSSRVIVFAIGKRARDVSAHLKRNVSGGKVDAEDSASVDFDIVRKRSDRRLLDPRDAPRVRAVFLVLDEDDPDLEISLQDAREAILDLGNSGIAVVLAPALPAKYPSRLIDQASSLPIFVELVDAVLDTSIARSPLWWGNRKRSLDRRIADVIYFTAVSLASTEFSASLRGPYGRGTKPVLSAGIRDRKILKLPPEIFEFGSEESWPSGDVLGASQELLVASTDRANIRTGDAFGHGGGVHIDSLDRDPFPFRRLVDAFIPQLASATKSRSDLLPLLRTEAGFVPRELDAHLKYGKYTTAYRFQERSTLSRGMVVTGETPTIEAVRAANEGGWRIARYTDTAAIQEVLDEPGKIGMLPREVDLGQVYLASPDRRLATRGVDPRDVVRISAEQSWQWLDELPRKIRDEAELLARPMRSASKLYAEERGDLLVPRNFLATDSVAATTLRRVLNVSTPAEGERALRRASDLERCWTPSPTWNRYAIIDGSIPIVIARMGRGEVPVEDLFAIDGTEAVVALFSSRVFEVWAKATLPSASSWMARFSVGNTFAGFPFVAPFVIGRDDIGTGLYFDRDAPGRREFEQLAKGLERYLERSSIRPHRGRPYRSELDTEAPGLSRLHEMIMGYYGLQTNADEIEILTRLLDLNRRLS